MPRSSLAPIPTPAPAHPKHWYILDPQLVTDILHGPYVCRGLQVEHEPGSAVDGDVGHHCEGVPGRAGKASAGQPRKPHSHFPRQPQSELLVASGEPCDG